MNQLDSIKQFTTVVADSGDIESIRHYHPEDATTNPSLLLKAAGLASYSGLIDDAIAWAKKQGGGREAQVAHACDKLAVNFGAEILKSIPGTGLHRGGRPALLQPREKYREGSPPGGAVSGDGH